MTCIGWSIARKRASLVNLAVEPWNVSRNRESRRGLHRRKLIWDESGSSDVEFISFNEPPSSLHDR